MATLTPIAFRVTEATYLFGRADDARRVGDALSFERAGPRSDEVAP
ncbi:MAG: hypothetical protein BWY52_02650 [Chloroflexi bacterium ADurb.Bin325]|nr:MAG: hypothetical protein BWY52_02650 [Chloroflexi bacterium ADurb.Bin325]